MLSAKDYMFIVQMETLFGGCVRITTMMVLSFGASGSMVPSPPTLSGILTASVQLVGLFCKIALQD